MKSLTIKRIQSVSELKSCAEILVSAYNSEPWNDSWTLEKALEKLTCFYNSPKFHGWMAFQGEQLLGCCVGNVEPYFSGDYFYLKEMFVTKNSQGNGIGKALLVNVKEFLPSINVEAMILFTAKNFFPFDFYLKSGFSEMEDMRMMHYARE